MRADPKAITTEASMLVLWLHECARVFEDRLINDEDHAWFTAMQDKSLGELFGTSLSTLVPGERLIFGDFMIPSAPSPPSARCYQARVTKPADPVVLVQMLIPRCILSLMTRQGFSGWSKSTWMTATPSLRRR